MDIKSILIIGSGYMAGEYLKVIKNLGYNAIVVGRGTENIKLMEEKYPEFRFYTGGLETFLNNSTNYPQIAINTVNVENLRISTELLLNAGIKKVLIEKPGDLTVAGILKLDKLATDYNAECYIAYNRRFYSSVNEVLKQSVLDGGILSAHFEFTEWIHTIDPTLYKEETLKRWIIANSSHVIDTVFHLIGIPKLMNSLVSGQNQISWHPSGSKFIGSGISNKNIPFSYHSNWQAPGRWSIEILTKNNRLYLKPMETIQIQKNGSVAVEPMCIDDHLDRDFKPGVFLQTEAFLKGDFSKLCNIQYQKEMIENVYNKISGY